jgi:hypothetical protein
MSKKKQTQTPDKESEVISNKKAQETGKDTTSHEVKSETTQKPGALNFDQSAIEALNARITLKMGREVTVFEMLQMLYWKAGVEKRPAVKYPVGRILQTLEGETFQKNVGNQRDHHKNFRKHFQTGPRGSSHSFNNTSPIPVHYQSPSNRYVQEGGRTQQRKQHYQRYDDGEPPHGDPALYCYK